MLKNRAGRKFSRNTNSRRAMFRSLVRNLVLNGSIVTTETRAKTVSGKVDRIFKKLRRGTLSDKRSILASLGNDNTTYKKLSEYKTLSESRKSGFTKLTRLARRKGDNSLMVKFEMAEPADEIQKVVAKTVEKK